MQNDLLAALRDDPGNQSRRLIYADWLEERGSQQGALIRAQVELERTARNSSRFEILSSRVNGLEDFLAPDWIAVLEPYQGSRVVVAGGFVHEATFPAEQFAGNFAAILRQAPMLLSVCLHGVVACIESLHAAGVLQDFTGLRLPGELLLPEQLEELLMGCKRLNVIDVRGNHLRAAGLEMLLAHKFTAGVESLDLSATCLDDNCIEILLSSRLPWDQLNYLGLRHNQFSESGTEALLRSDQLRRVSRVELKPEPRSLPHRDLRYFDDLDDLDDTFFV